MSSHVDAVCRAVRLDAAVKARILPLAHMFAMDAEADEVARATGRELATTMLAQLGIKIDPADNYERMISAFLVGAEWGARNANQNSVFTGRAPDRTQLPPGRPDRPNNKLIGEPGWREERATMDGGESFIDLYLRAQE